jgi:BirA family transcriptional regulator, biotin operon repressor / biotin---[acetyl-CoA-carboxylase] ligase
MSVSQLGLPRLHLGDSTNERARRLAIAGAPHGTLVTASEQTAGRGRQGRSWSAPAGTCILMSLVTRENGGVRAQQPPLTPLAAAVAVTRVAGGEARIKWPNDVLVEGRKIAGILVEGRPQEGWAVVGIGVNVALRIDELPPELHETAGTLGLDVGDVEPTLERLLAELGDALSSSRSEVLASYRERDALHGEQITWNDGRGTAAGIDDAGRLLVTGDDGAQIALDAGEVAQVRGAGPA